MAMKKNRDLVLGKTIWMVRDVREKDKYQRLLRFVFVDNIFVNFELVKQGMANSAGLSAGYFLSGFFQEKRSLKPIRLLSELKRTPGHLWGFCPHPLQFFD